MRPEPETRLDSSKRFKSASFGGWRMRVRSPSDAPIHFVPGPLGGGDGMEVRSNANGKEVNSFGPISTCRSAGRTRSNS